MEDNSPPSEATPAGLKREVGVFGAVMMGLGSIVGTGVFVSLAIAAGAAGPAVLLAIAVAAVVAIFNGLSSAQLAANHPVSGGTYEYGYRWLHPALGFTAGWMFLCAKSASAATAALGFAGYLLHATARDGGADPIALEPIAVAIVVLVALLVISGIRRSNAFNIAVVSITLVSLAAFVALGIPAARAAGGMHLWPFFASPQQPEWPLAGFLQACALMFVAYTGYGRIATLAEEVRSPRRTIPLAVVVALLATMVLYLAVGYVGVASIGAGPLAAAGREQAAPLEAAARSWPSPAAAMIVSVGAVTAMLGVLLNLILGLSRVVLAMARRGDAPAVLAEIRESTAAPHLAVMLVAALVGGLTLLGDVRTTWSFSAFTVLVYYAITNLAAIRLSPQERLYPRVIPWLGLASCLFLAFWVEMHIWLTGLAVIAAGLAWFAVAQRRRRARG